MTSVFFFTDILSYMFDGASPKVLSRDIPPYIFLGYCQELLQRFPQVRLPKFLHYFFLISRGCFKSFSRYSSKDCFIRFKIFSGLSSGTLSDISPVILQKFFIALFLISSQRYFQEIILGAPGKGFFSPSRHFFRNSFLSEIPSVIP